MGGAVYSRSETSDAEVVPVKKAIASGVGIGSALVMFVGAGTAGANNEYKGLTYEKAVQQITAGHGTVGISSREGSYLPTEKCIVTGSRKANFLDSSGKRQGYKILLDLNCNDTLAGAHPGNSSATAEGKQAALWRKRAAYISKDYAKTTAAGESPICAKDDTYRKYCTKVCETSGACSAELLQSLGL